MTTDEIMLAELQAKAHEVYESAYAPIKAAQILHVKLDTLKPLIESGEIETVSYGGKPKRITPRGLANHLRACIEKGQDNDYGILA